MNPFGDTSEPEPVPGRNIGFVATRGADVKRCGCRIRDGGGFGARQGRLWVEMKAAAYREQGYEIAPFDEPTMIEPEIKT